MNLPAPSLKYDAQNEAAARRTIEQELARMQAELQSIRDALKIATTLPVVVRT